MGKSVEDVALYKTFKFFQLNLGRGRVFQSSVLDKDLADEIIDNMSPEGKLDYGEKKFDASTASVSYRRIKGRPSIEEIPLRRYIELGKPKNIWIKKSTTYTVVDD